MPGFYLFSPCRHRGGAPRLGSPGSGGITWAVLVEGAERAQRRQVIVNAAGELAESEGWEAVTTRRLAGHIEYSQPVLYSHFEGKHAIVSAVASRGLGSGRATHNAARRPFACCNAASGRQHLHQGVKVRLPLHGSLTAPRTYDVTASHLSIPSTAGGKVLGVGCWDMTRSGRSSEAASRHRRPSSSCHLPPTVLCRSC